MFPLLRFMATAMIPRRCASCGTPLDQREEGWCMPCAFTWARIAISPLNRFGDRLEWSWADAWIKMTGQEERQLVHALKYGGDPRLGRLLGRTMALELQADQRTEGLSDWAVVPIPLHSRRQRQRGYNQSECLAEGWNEVTGMPLIRLLRRAKAGRSLTGFGRHERIAEGCSRFQWSEPTDGMPHPLKGLLVMDDVITTGSTLEEAHRVLRAHWHGPLGFLTLMDAAV